MELISSTPLLRNSDLEADLCCSTLQISSKDGRLLYGLFQHAATGGEEATGGGKGWYQTHQEEGNTRVT